MTASSRHFAPGSVIFREGEPASSLYVVKQGTVSIRKTGRRGTVEIATISRNEILGEMSLFDRLPRSADAVATTAVDLVEIEYEALDTVLSGVPPYLRTIIECIVDRLRRADETIRQLQGRVPAP